MKDLTDFETEFRELLIKHDLQACFIAVVEENEKGSRLFIGGTELLTDWCERTLRAGKALTDAAAQS